MDATELELAEDLIKTLKRIADSLDYLTGAIEDQRILINIKDVSNEKEK